MYRNRKYIRVLAIFMVVNMLQSIFLPPLANALTSGPTTPEATSFEPVDMTDMVNLQTGDFTYSVPLLEVPGPEGGYPLALSYHAGIKPLEDASWVGLGWNLNPGAINRTVNGLPDDHNDVKRTVHDYWEGGETHTFSVGAGIGVAGVNVGLDLRISSDTYQGFRGDTDISLSLKNILYASYGSSGLRYGASISRGVGPLGVNMSAGSEGFNGSLSIGIASKYGSLSGSISTNFEGSTSYGFNASMGVIGVGASIADGSTNKGISVGGVGFSQTNTNYGKISTESFNIKVPIKGLNLGYNYTRYWMDETDDVWSFGTLYGKDAVYNNNNLPLNGPIDKTFDCYAMLDPEVNIKLYNKPDSVLGGSLPSYDNFQVLGQGISGVMQPYILDNMSLFREKATTDEPGPTGETIVTNFLQLTQLNKDVNFRFDNDFSNNFRYNALPGFSFSTDVSEPWTGHLINNYTTASNGQHEYYNSADHILPGSKYVKWFTNTEIKNGSARLNGFIDYPGIAQADREKLNGTHNNTLGKLIGGFSIIKEDGMTYHYALPAYTFNEYRKSELIDQSNGDSYNEQFNSEPYAYTWLLTAITGPDFVDVDYNGFVDDNDLGYWVTFDYGLWVEDYKWRTPSIGAIKDINNEVKTFSKGEKQIYYLDIIKTRTHSALFVKDLRYDGKSITSNEEFGYSGGTLCGLNDPSDYPSEFSKSSLRLNKIFLLNNRDLNSIITSTTALKSEGGYASDQITHNCEGALTIRNHFSDNIIDGSDLAANNDQYDNQLTASSIKVIELDNNHYDLCPETINSLTNEFYSSPVNPNYDVKGKLTLKGVKFKGVGGHDYLPPLEFNYELDNPVSAIFSTHTASQQVHVNINGSSNFSEGDIIKYTDSSNKDYYGVLDETLNPSYDFLLRSIGENQFVSGLSGQTLIQTKNPPFNIDNYDFWGNYKADFKYSAQTASSHLQRQPSTTSAKSIDAWSLRSIKNSLGSTTRINYEPKAFTDTELLSPYLFKSRWVVKGDFYTSTNRELKIYFEEEEVDLRDYFITGTLPFLILEVDGATSCEANSNATSNSIFIQSIFEDYLVIKVPNDFYTATCPNHSCISFGDAYVKLIAPSNGYGNGIRVASIDLLNASDVKEKSTEYQYFGGKTTYIPFQAKWPSFTFCNSSSNYPTELEDYFNDYKKIIAEGSFIPSPGVMYATAEVIEKAKNDELLGKRKYTFQTYENSNDEMLEFDRSSIATGSLGSMETNERNVTIIDKTSAIGNLLRVEEYNGKNQLVNTTTNDYASTTIEHNSYNNQGVIHQAFNEVRYVNNSDERNAVITMTKTYPSQLMSTSYQSNNGSNTMTYYREYDFLSGEPVKVEYSDGLGNNFVSISEPAYQVDNFVYGNMLTGSGSTSVIGMGSPVHFKNNRNMLTQNAATYSYRSDGTGNTIGNPLSASITTWEDNWLYRQPNIPLKKYVDETVNPHEAWRKHKAYIWKSDIYPDGTYQTYTPFDWDDLAASETIGWLPVSEVTRYDPYSKALEEKDIVGDYGTAKMGYDQTRVVASAGNARYTEIAFSGAEDVDADGFSSEVYKDGATASTEFAHTGDYSFENTNTIGPLYKALVDTAVSANLEVERGKKYRASVWVKDTANLTQQRIYFEFQNNDGTATSGLASGSVYANNYSVKAGDWVRLDLDIDIPNSSTYDTKLLVVSCENQSGSPAYFDDFRLHPLDVSMNSYVYDQHTGQLTFVLDAENFYTQYIYDDAGRLIQVYTETPENETGKRLVTKHEYHYARPLN